MGCVRNHHMPIQNSNNNMRYVSGFERRPAPTRNEANCYNNGRDHRRKFEESFHNIAVYNNGPASKRRRETNFNNPLSYNNGLSLSRRVEESLCNSTGINNNLSVTCRMEESFCNTLGFGSSSVFPRIAEENSCNTSRFNDQPALARVEEIIAASSNSEGPDLYLSREEIERCSPSRRDGIDLQKETYLRYSYCAFLQTLGMRLQLPQTTIATAMVLCHRFFVRRSHASHDRFLIATAALFLAAKSEETPRPLNSVLIVSYEICHKHDLASFHYLLPIDWFEQYKERVLKAEQMLLTTLDFELTVQHPYNPLMSVLNKIGLDQTVLVHVAWNLVSEGLRSSLCLQFKPHHIAAGAAFLAAKFLNFDLSSNQGLWQEFQTPSIILRDVVQQLTELF